ncbi:MAG: GNAT family N-acetyltransferase [Limnoraphis sp.]
MLALPSCTNEKVALAKTENLPKIKALADAHRLELGFVNRAMLAAAIDNNEIFYTNKGFIQFHHRRDNISTLHLICVHETERSRGEGKKLIEAWEQDARKKGIRQLRLKCPIDLVANGFYQHLGFRRVSIDPGKRRSLVVWEKPILSEMPQIPQFIASLSAGGSEIKRLEQLWNQGGDPRNPFENVLYSPLSCSASTTEYLKKAKYSGKIKNVWIDCGAYQVQQGKRTYEELLVFLDKFYRENQWADGYVLPDIVPLSTDSDEIVEYKVRETLHHCKRFFQVMPTYIQERAIAPVQGRKINQINRCLETYTQLGIKRIGFGSWGTSGKNGSVNMLSTSSLNLFKTVHDIAREHHSSVHCFGIGGPNSFKRLRDSELIPHTFDSTTWWKAGGFGSIFFPNTSQIQITVRRGFETTKVGLEQLKQQTNHQCYFCESIEKLRGSRNHRIMHNLVAWLDTLRI